MHTRFDTHFEKTSISPQALYHHHKSYRKIIATGEFYGQNRKKYPIFADETAKYHFFASV